MCRVRRWDVHVWLSGKLLNQWLRPQAQGQQHVPARALVHLAERPLQLICYSVAVFALIWLLACTRHTSLFRTWSCTAYKASPCWAVALRFTADPICTVP